MNDAQETNWTEVTAKCLCFISLQLSDVKNGTVLERAKFLAGLGLSRPDRAGVLGSTPHSLAELERQGRKKKTAKYAKKR